MPKHGLGHISRKNGFNNNTMNHKKVAKKKYPDKYDVKTRRSDNKWISYIELPLLLSPVIWIEVEYHLLKMLTNKVCLGVECQN